MDNKEGVVNKGITTYEKWDVVEIYSTRIRLEVIYV